MRRASWLVMGVLLACAEPVGSAPLDAGTPPNAALDASRDASATPADGSAERVAPDADDADDAEARRPIPSVNPVLAAACAGRARGGVDGPLPTFRKQQLMALPGAGYIKPRDLDGDGYPELLVSALSEGIDLTQLAGGPPLAFGGAYLLAREGAGTPGTLGTFARRKVFDRNDGIAWPNASELFDVDNDGLSDWVIGAGFLVKPAGALVWMKRTGDTSFGPPQRIVVPDTNCWYHEARPLDMEGDGDTDFITTCHVGSTSNFAGPSRLEWFENQGEDAASFVPRALNDGGGALLTLFDLDGDGDQDVIAPQFFGGEALVWFEHAADGRFAKHVINDTTGRGFIVRLADMDGDGRTDLVYGNHNNEIAEDPSERTMGIYWFEVPDADTISTLPHWDAYRHTVYEGFEVYGDGNGAAAGAPGMLNVGDLDGDCDVDITASGDGDIGLYAFIQGSAGFEAITLDKDPNNVNSGEQHVLDLDDDGDADIVWAVFGSTDPLMALSSGFSSSVYAFLRE